MGAVEEPRGGPELKKILIVAAQIVATIVVTWFVATRAGLGAAELGAIDLAAWDVSFGLLALSCLVLAAGYFGTGFLWGHIVHGMGGPRLPVAVAVRLFMVANLGRYVPGKVWQIAGLVALAKGRGVSGPTAAAAALLGQGVSLGAAILVGLGSLWTMADGAAWGWALPLGLAAAAALALTPPVFRALVAAWFRLAKADPPADLAPAHAAGWLGVAVGTWVLYGGAFWLLVEGLGLEVGALTTASAFAAAYVLGYVMVFAPAGIGVREGFLVALLAPHVGAGPAGAVAVIARLWTTVIEVIPAAAFWARHVSATHAKSP